MRSFHDTYTYIYIAYLFVCLLIYRKLRMKRNSHEKKILSFAIQPAFFLHLGMAFLVDPSLIKRAQRALKAITTYARSTCGLRHKLRYLFRASAINSQLLRLRIRNDPKHGRRKKQQRRNLNLILD